MRFSCIAGRLKIQVYQKSYKKSFVIRRFLCVFLSAFFSDSVQDDIHLFSVPFWMISIWWCNHNYKFNRILYQRLASLNRAYHMHNPLIYTWYEILRMLLMEMQPILIKLRSLCVWVYFIRIFTFVWKKDGWRGNRLELKSGVNRIVCFDVRPLVLLKCTTLYARIQCGWLMLFIPTSLFSKTLAVCH